MGDTTVYVLGGISLVISLGGIVGLLLIVAL
jgi:hypothetical protein